MSVFAPIVFKSTDAGAPALSGSVSALVGVLSACLICNKMFTAISGASFVDNTVEARSQGGTAFTLFQGPTVTVDEAYVGMTAKFGRAKFIFGTAGVQNAAITLAWEYWNGSAWTALSGLTDGTTKLTVNGTVTWTIPGNWATTAVNGVTQFWMRVRFTAGSWTTNPLVATLSVTGWSIAFGPTTNEAAYQQGGGNGFYLNVNDNGPGAGLAREARITGFETMSALATGTGQFPTAAQVAIGIGALVVRKSTTADGTARAWAVVADDRTFYLFVIAGDTAGRYRGYMFGDVFSYVTNDSFRTMIIGRNIENNSADTNEGLSALAHAASGPVTVGLNPTHFVARSYTGVGGSQQVAKEADMINTAIIGNFAGALVGACVGQGVIPFPNTPDGGLYLSLVQIHDILGLKRGRLRGFWAQYHPVASFADGDTFAGTGALAGKTFLVLKDNSFFVNPATGVGLFVMETSDTWEAN